jgi:hypothetical protein
LDDRVQSLNDAGTLHRGKLANFPRHADCEACEPMTRATAWTALFASIGFCLAHGCAGGEDELGHGHAFDDAGTTSSPPEAGANITTPSTDAKSDVPPPVCGHFVLEAKLVPAKVIVVFDQSQSMDTPFQGGEPKWTVARDAVTAAITPLAPKLEVGVAFYPTTAPKTPLPIGAPTCPEYLVAPMNEAPQIPIMKGVDFLPAWSAHFDPPWETILSTPLVLAIEAASDVFLDPAAPPGPKALVVVGDGAPTCAGSEEQVTAPIAELNQAGIKTHVIALTSSLSTAIWLLNTAAVAGGTEYARVPTNVSDISSALSDIVGSTIDECSLTFDPPPPNADEIHLIATEAGKEPYEIHEGVSWTLSDDGKSVKLSDELCEAANGGKYQKLEWIFGCPDTIVK